MRRCLIVDDDPLYVEILTRIVGPHGLDVTAAATASEAIAALTARDYEVILLDMHLAGSGGDEVIEFLRRLKPHLLQRVVAVTASPGVTRHLSASVPVVDKGSLGTLEQRVREILL